MSNDIHVVLMQYTASVEGDEQAAGLLLTPWGVPIVAHMTDDLRMLVARTAADFPDVKYTICKLVEVEAASHVH